jgi:hypothetical protein
MPAKVTSKCAEVLDTNIIIKRRLRDEMISEQGSPCPY